MSLTDNERNALINLYWEKSKATMKDAKANYEMQMWSSAANRLYYAMFHAVKALFIQDKKEVSSHHGMKALLGNDYVNKGLITPDEGRAFSQMETMREKADYDCYYNITADDINEKMPIVESFLKRIAQLIGKE